MALYTWESLSPDGSLLALKYKFSFGTANTFAARLDDGTWLVVSPAINPPEAVFDELAKHGPVSALLAPNAFHHMGQAAWRARFPQATSYAATGALPRLSKQASGLPFESMEVLQAKLPSRIALLSPAGMKQPDLMVRATSGEVTTWFSGDLLSNTTKDDVSLLTRMIFSAMGGGLGFRFNPVPSMVYLKDRKAWLSSVRSAFSAQPPTIVVPAHGDIVREDAATRSQSALA